MQFPAIFYKKKCWISVGIVALVAVAIAITLAVLLTGSEEQTVEPPKIDDELRRTFPKDFIFGTASSAYQIEGSWNADGKGPNIWDDFTHHLPDRIFDKSNGDNSSKGYELYKRDVQLLKSLGVNFYRFSISWSRVLPDGDISSRNEAGLQYYHNLIDELLRNGIEPMVTIYHWDLPLKLQDLGGWSNPMIVQYFVQYAGLLYGEYANKVKYWNTINEPYMFCVIGYGSKDYAPRDETPGVADYLCGHHALLAHAQAYRLYEKEYRKAFNGSVGIVINMSNSYPKNSNYTEDVEAANRYYAFNFGWFADPIFGSTGDYPAILREIVDKNSKDENRRWSRLPTFTANEIKMIKGSSDFLGLNYYTSVKTTPNYNIHETPNPSVKRDMNVSTFRFDDRLKGKSAWLFSVPEGLRDLLITIKTEYNNPEVIITENGYSDEGGLNDVNRMQYIRDHLDAILEAHWNHGCNIKGYTYWSFLDSFEWQMGYSEKFGLFSVDFSKDSRDRAVKDSVKFYRNIIESRRIPEEYPSPNDVPGQFPKRFAFGSASSAYQIEGGWNKDGKGPSIWDTLTQRSPESIADKSNGNVAANSYEFYMKDIEALKEVGLNYYRFSISWPRVLPNGDISSKNEKGLKYYDDLVNALIANGIEPQILMYHWDLPQSIQDLGGWMNPLIVDYSIEYAKLLFNRYADRVKTWYTLNEPAKFCLLGYGTGYHAPQMVTRGIGEYLCGHHVLLANAKIYHIYRNNYYTNGGKIGITLNTDYFWPKDQNNLEDVEAANRALQFELGWFAHPIFSETGDYPSVMRKIIDKNSEDENLRWSRLPKFTNEEITLVKGSSDFFALNYYTSYYVEKHQNLSELTEPSFARDENIEKSVNPNWPVAASTWLRSVPEGFRAILNWIKKEYKNPDIYITENGWSDNGGLEDASRIKYINTHLQAVLDAIWIDGCRVMSYTYWSIIDNFEWLRGYTERFGLYSVNFTSPEMERTPKHSSFYLNTIIQSRQLMAYDPVSTSMKYEIRRNSTKNGKLI